MTIISFIAEIFYIPRDSAAAEPIRRRPSAKQTPAHISAHWSWVWGLAANHDELLCPGTGVFTALAT